MTAAAVVEMAPFSAMSHILFLNMSDRIPGGGVADPVDKRRSDTGARQRADTVAIDVLSDATGDRDPATVEDAPAEESVEMVLLEMFWLPCVDAMPVISRRRSRGRSCCRRHCYPRKCCRGGP